MTALESLVQNNSTTVECESKSSTTATATTSGVAANEKTKCAECQKTDSFLWRPLEEKCGFICHECHENRNVSKKKALTETKGVNKENEEEKPCCSKTIKSKELTTSTTDFPDINTDLIVPTRTLRKSTRARAVSRPTRLKSGKISKNANGQVTASTNSGSSNSKTQTKGRNRRTLFKKVPVKMTTSEQLSTRFVESLFYKGSYLQIGDIVSCIDSNQCVYYAQIRGLLIDSYCEKSAFLTWLIPTIASPEPNDGFDPSTYIIGPDEEFSRRLSCLEFVMHAPSDYYLDRSTPFPTTNGFEQGDQKAGFIWTSLPEIKRNNPAYNQLNN